MNAPGGPAAEPTSPPAGTPAGWLAARADRAWAYDYFATLRRLECMDPRAPRWGQALRPSAEAVRVGQEPSLSFAPAPFSRFEPATPDAPPRLRQHFFGYLGPNGPLPVHLSDFIRERALNHGDPTWLAFLDTFSHRF
ncbi:MAG TPA: type VI secretion system baseplate subunit TssG, partial [Burkholderiaceae bacterium]|nr:type VI secretion system baseplate subunit TssG [Burkholderiaceae bacterium]